MWPTTASVGPPAVPGDPGERRADPVAADLGAKLEQCSRQTRAGADS